MKWLVTIAWGLCFGVIGVLSYPPMAESREKILRIAAFDYKPFVDSTSPHHGYIAELAAAALKRTGYQAEYQFYPLKRALLLARKGKVDGVLGAYYAQNRTGYLEYSDPMGEILINFFARKDSEIPAAVVHELKDYRVGVLLGTSLIADLLRDGLKPDPAPENINNLHKLLAKRIDLFVGTTEWIRHDLQANFSKAEQNAVVVLEPPYQRQQVYFTVSKKNPDVNKIIRDFNKGLETIRASGTYRAIQDAHGIIH